MIGLLFFHRVLIKKWGLSLLPTDQHWSNTRVQKPIFLFSFQNFGLKVVCVEGHAPHLSGAEKLLNADANVMLVHRKISDDEVQLGDIFHKV